VSDFQSNLDYIKDLFGPDVIRILIKDMKKETFGRWCVFTNRIIINRGIGQYWSLLFTTLIHEYGHSKQRRLWGIVILFFMIMCMGGMWFYNTFMPSQSGILYLLARSLSLLVFGAICWRVGISVHNYTEQDADECGAGFVQGIILFLSLLEELEILHSHKKGKKVIPKYVGLLNKMMQEHTPELLD